MCKREDECRCDGTGYDPVTGKLCSCDVLNPLTIEDEALLRHVDGYDDELPQGLHQGTTDEKIKQEHYLARMFDDGVSFVEGLVDEIDILPYSDAEIEQDIGLAIRISHKQV